MFILLLSEIPALLVSGAYIWYAAGEVRRRRGHWRDINHEKPASV
jgi:hypothetical protein